MTTTKAATTKKTVTKTEVGVRVAATYDRQADDYTFRLLAEDEEPGEFERVGTVTFDK